LVPFKSDRDISEFLLRACHDVRAAARGVRAHSELLSRDAASAGNPDLDRRIGFIVEGARKIDSLMDGLSNYSVALQIEPGSFQTVSLEIVMRAAIAKANKDLRESAGEVDAGPLPAVLGNADRLIQLFEQLIRNALVHRGEDAPRVSVRAERDAEGWLFTVRDNGMGIEPDSLEAIFKPFERLHGAGAGMGLAICREIVNRHGGRIWAEAPVDGGAEIRFRLPASD
jgi:signal transduction histidine kinase